MLISFCHIHIRVTILLPKVLHFLIELGVIKSISAKRVFKEVPEIKKELWGGEFWTDGYYIATISGKGNKEVIEKNIRNQGREKDIEQLKMFSA
ncbi:MAG TPA: hypothetical protein ENH38_07430 [Nitrospirae bacterium]|nr:hypothetical protein [Nitrospirota bacterium]